MKFLFSIFYFLNFSREYLFNIIYLTISLSVAKWNMEHPSSFKDASGEVQVKMLPYLISRKNLWVEAKMVRSVGSQTKEYHPKLSLIRSSSMRSFFTAEYVSSGTEHYNTFAETVTSELAKESPFSIEDGTSYASSAS
jgi:hypothetical protein